MSYDNTRPVLVCTLGGKAQVVTFTIDALLKEKVEIGRLIVIHHASKREDDRLKVALTILEQEVQKHYRNRFTIQAVNIADDQAPITDVNDAAALSVADGTLRKTIGELKKVHREIHYCFTGGRRLLAMQAMSVLSLHATPADALWHLYTPDLLRAQAGTNEILHADAHPTFPPPYLIRVPLVPWAHFFQGLRELLALNPEKAIQFSDKFLDEREAENCRKAWASLSRSLQITLYHLVKGKSPQDTATEMGISLGSVQGYITDIRQVLRNVWGLDEKFRISFEWMQQKFAPVVDKLV